MFWDRLPLSSELYHTEAIPLRLVEIQSLLQKTGNSFWLWRRRLYVGFYAEECEEGPTCLHYQIRAEGFLARALLHFGKHYLRRKLASHARRLFFFALWNTGRAHPDLAGWEHTTHRGLLLRFPPLDPGRITRLGNTTLPWHIRYNLKLQRIIQKKNNIFFSARNERKTSKKELVHRYRRLLVCSWLLKQSELHSILPPPFLPSEIPERDYVRLYSLQAYDAGPLDSKSGLSRYGKGRERESGHCLLAPVFCISSNKRYAGYLPLWQSRTRIPESRIEFRPFTASLNFYKNFIRMDMGDFRRRLLARAEFVPERGLSVDDSLPAPLAGASLQILRMHPEGLALEFQDYEIAFALNRVTLLRRLTDSSREQGWEEFWKEQLGISTINSDQAWLVSYLDLRPLGSETHDLCEFQYRPHSASAHLPHD